MPTPELKLAKLPDRKPVKLTLMVMPDLHDALEDYARLYAEAYGRKEVFTNLIPAMLTSFLDNDRGFVRARASLAKTNEETRRG